MIVLGSYESLWGRAGSHISSDIMADMEGYMREN